MKYLFLALTFLGFVTSSYGLDAAYNDGENFAANNGLQLVVPDDIAAFGLNQDTTSLQKHNDTTLADAGSKELEKNGMNSILADSVSAAINAREEHQINVDNGLIKNSLLAESNAESVVVGKEFKNKSLVKQEKTGSCDEGVAFTVDIMRQLVYIPPPRQTTSAELVIYYPNYVKNVGFRNDEIALLKIGFSNHQMDMNRFKAHACSHFDPVDANTGQRFKIDCNRIQNFIPVKIVDFNRDSITDKYGQRCNPVRKILIKYIHDTHQSEAGSQESWSVLNPGDEELVQNNSCYEVSRECLDSGAKYFDELEVNRKCWKEKISYQCSSPPENGCAYYKDNNCTLDESNCLRKHGNLCLQWHKKYKCTLETEVINSGVQGSDLFCLGGDCFTPSMNKNTDMNEAVAQLAIMKEMQSQIIPGDSLKVFKGAEMSCSTHMASFLNCCASAKGWGKSLGLASCSEAEKSLANLRDKSLCHYVGTYCAEKKLGICIRKKSTYCCFDSKISRVLHEQGRAQCGRGWGDADNPDCQPFTVDELTKIDFSKINLSEVFTDLFKNVKNSLGKCFPKQLQDQMPIMQRDIHNNRKADQQNFDTEGTNEHKITRSTF